MAMGHRHRHVSLPLNRQTKIRVFHKRATDQVGRTRFYVLMAELLNQLMVHHNVLSACVDRGREKEEFNETFFALELVMRPVEPTPARQTVSLLPI